MKYLPSVMLAFVLALVAVLIWSVAIAADPTAEQWKATLQTPVALFAIMLLASLGSAFAQIVKAARAGQQGASLGVYFGKYWPETLIMLGLNAGAFATLLMSDQLNFGSAIGIGYASNSLADVFRADGRSAELAKPAA